MTPKDATVQTRLTQDEKAQLQAIADVNDESLSQTVRRAIRAFLAAAAVLVAVLGLSACGASDQPSAEPVATQAPAVVPEPVATAEPTTEHATPECVTADAITAKWRALPDPSHPAAVKLAAYEALLPQIPPDSVACTDADRSQFMTYRNSLEINIEDMKAILAGH